MSTYIGIEKTTDQRYSCDFKIKKFKTLSTAIKWKESFDNGKFTFEGCATDSIPSVSQNYHRSFRTLYEVKTGFRLPTDAQVKKVLRKRPYQGSSMYHYSFDYEKLNLLGWDKLIEV